MRYEYYYSWRNLTSGASLLPERVLTHIEEKPSIS